MKEAHQQKDDFLENPCTSKRKKFSTSVFPPGGLASIVFFASSFFEIRLPNIWFPLVFPLDDLHLFARSDLWSQHVSSASPKRRTSMDLLLLLATAAVRRTRHQKSACSGPTRPSCLQLLCQRDDPIATRDIGVFTACMVSGIRRYAMPQ